MSTNYSKENAVRTFSNDDASVKSSVFIAKDTAKIKP